LPEPFLLMQLLLRFLFLFSVSFFLNNYNA